MRFDLINAVFRKELAETLRDRRSLAVMFGIPLILYPLVVVGIYGISHSRQQKLAAEVYSVGVVHQEGAPHLIEMLKAEGGLRIVSPSDPQSALRRQNVAAVIELPADLKEQTMEKGEGKIIVRLDSSLSASKVVREKIDAILHDYEKWVITRRLARQGISESVLQPIQTQVEDIASAGQRMGKIMAMALPNILLLTGMLGAFFPALNATTTERESGTLEALLATPARKIELLLGKGAVVLLCSLLTAALNLLSMSLVLWRVLTLAGTSGALDVNFSALLLTFVAAVPTLIFFSGLVMIVGLFSRSFREANSYATPVMLLPLISLAVSLADPATSVGLLLTPIVNTTLVIRDVLVAHASTGAFLLAFASSCAYAGLMLSLAARMFTSERLVNPAWEGGSFKALWQRSGPRRLPTIDEAVALFFIVLLLMFYVSPSFGATRLMRVVAGNEILLIAAPTLLLAWLGRYRWREVFSFRRPRMAELGAAVLLGVGLVLACNVLTTLQNSFWPADPQSMEAQAKLLLPALLSHPVLTVLVVAGLAGICEELMFRGSIQSALRRRLPMWPTIIIGGFLFAALHMDLHGLGARWIIGVFLGWIVWRSGSILPAMLMHGIFDAVQLGRTAWSLHGMTMKEAMVAAMAPASAIAPVELMAWFVGGMILILASVALFRHQWRLQSPAGIKPASEAVPTGIA